MPRALSTGTCIGRSVVWLYVGTLHPAGWPILFCGPTQEPCASHSQHREKMGEVLEKCRWMDRKCRNKQERKKSPAVSVACMAIYWPTPGLKGRTFKLCVLTRWDFNFFVRSSPLRGSLQRNTLHKTCLVQQQKKEHSKLENFILKCSNEFISNVLDNSFASDNQQHRMHATL